MGRGRDWAIAYIEDLERIAAEPTRHADPENEGARWPWLKTFRGMRWPRARQWLDERRETELG